MSTHMAAWFESIDQAALGRINTVQDDVLTPSGVDRFLVPREYNHIHWGVAPDKPRGALVCDTITYYPPPRNVGVASAGSWPNCSSTRISCVAAATIPNH